MPLTVGELTAYLTVNKDGYQRGIRDAKGELNQLARDADRQSDATANRTSRLVNDVSRSMATVGRDADRQGRDAGGKLAQGINQGIIRHSPLIVAGVSAALAAGAPAAIAGATVLFGGIGAVAAAQSQDVQAAWAGLWDGIKRGAQQDAAVLVPVFERMAGQIGASFERMRPLLRDAFEAVGPQVDTFTDSLTQAAENALPGLVRAVQSAGPVMDGLGSLMEDMGTGLTGFFDAMSSHAPAAGAAFAAIGDIMGELLPILGELLGQGAELAAVVLPPLASVLGVVADALEMLGPLLPVVAAGFLGMRVAGSVANGIQSLAASITGLVRGGLTGLATKATEAGSSLTGIGTAGGVAGGAVAGLAAGVALYAAAIADSEQRTREWTSALNEGGEAAARARDEMAEQAALIEQQSTGWRGFLNDITGVSNATSIYADDVENANQAHQDYLASLTPLAAAQRDVRIAEEALAVAIREHGAESFAATTYQAVYEDAQRDAAVAAGELEQAIHGVTQAMVDQANQALAAIDSGFAYRNSLDQLEDAQSALNEAINEHGRNSEEASRASLALEEQAFATASAFGRQQADLSGLDASTVEYTRLLQQETLGELYRLRDAAGPQMAEAISQQIRMLEANGVVLDDTAVAANAVADRMRGLGLSIEQVPGQKFVRIDAPTDDQRRRIEDLGYKVVTLPDGSVYVAASTGDAEAALNWVARNRWSTVYQTVRQTVTSITGGLVATGGRIGDVPVRKLSGGGRVEGPGGPTDDQVGPFLSRRALIFLSDDEHVTRASSAKKYGDVRMAAVNAGTAEILLPGERPRVRALAGGGAVRDYAGSATAATGRVINVGGVVVKIDGTFDLVSSRDLRRAGEKIRDVIRELDREVS